MVVHIAACDLRVEPLADISLATAAAARHLLRAEWAGSGHRAVEAEFVAKAHHHAAVTSRKVTEEAPDKSIELLLIDHHSFISSALRHPSDRHHEENAGWPP